MKHQCPECGAGGKYLGVFRDCSGEREGTYLIYRCESCGHLWTAEGSRKLSVDRL